MHLVIKMDMDNAAFDDVEGNGRSSEAARILRELADNIDGHPHFSPGHDQALMDENGNEVGYMQVKDGRYESPSSADRHIVLRRVQPGVVGAQCSWKSHSGTMPSEKPERVIQLINGLAGGERVTLEWV